MWLTRLDIKIGWLLFCDWLKEQYDEWQKNWRGYFHLTDEQLMAPGYTPGYTK